MKTGSFALLSSVVVAIVSVLVFREHLLETITALLHNNSYDDDPNAHTPTESTMSVPRAIRKVFLAVEQAEGAGARVRRSIGTSQLRSLTPFLMLDHFSVKPGAGFPDHPHRGQEVRVLLLH